ncbi:hypothetical protein FF38_06572 [Lucilia cuprina]|uniref:Uncharacterized protein n=1 Tax=Lucilia cuprina TaxID=7375 RepID=A0A0L0CAZ9_LUCCU|nr:hypothetical protein FF38_06572 [Lucilia cuprina]
MPDSGKENAPEFHCPLHMLYIRLNPHVQFCIDVHSNTVLDLILSPDIALTAFWLSLNILSPVGAIFILTQFTHSVSARTSD